MNTRLLFSFVLITIFCSALHAGRKNENELAELKYFTGLSVNKALALSYGCEKEHELAKTDKRDTSNLWENEDEKEACLASRSLTLSDFYVEHDENDCSDNESHEAHLAQGPISPEEECSSDDDTKNSSCENEDVLGNFFNNSKLKARKKRMQNRLDKIRIKQAHNHYTGGRKLKKKATAYKTFRDLVKNQQERKWAPKGMRKDKRNAKPTPVLQLVHTHKVRLKKIAVV